MDRATLGFALTVATSLCSAVGLAAVQEPQRASFAGCTGAAITSAPPCALTSDAPWILRLGAPDATADVIGGASASTARVGT